MKYLKKFNDIDSIMFIGLCLGCIIFIMTFVIGTLNYNPEKLLIKEVIEQRPIVTTTTITSQTIQSQLEASIGQNDLNNSDIINKNITGQINITYTTADGENITEMYSVQQIHNKQMPTIGSTINKTYYIGKYKLNNGKTIIISSTELLKKGDSSVVEDKFHYNWTQINPQTDPIETTIKVHYKRKAGIYTKHYAKTLPYTINP